MKVTDGKSYENVGFRAGGYHIYIYTQLLQTHISIAALLLGSPEEPSDQHLRKLSLDKPWFLFLAR